MLLCSANPISAQETTRFARLTDYTPREVSEYETHALTNQGNAQNGQQLFLNEQKTQCITCHQMGRMGSTLGPNLSGIGGKFDRPHLIDSLLDPSREIVEGFNLSHFAMQDGHLISGIVKAENTAEVQLIDAKAKWHRINLAEVETRKTDKISIMPKGLEKNLTKEEFTDLIAFLESSRPGGYSPGDRTAGAYLFPDGFEVNIVATGLTAAASMEVLPDGSILICEQTGTLRMVRDGVLLHEPVLTMAVERNRERGLLGVTAHPNFPQTPYIYTCKVLPMPYTHHRISQWTLTGDTIDPASEVILLEGDNQRMLGGNDPASAQGGGMHFGTDGCLYISIGEQTAASPSHSLNSLLGKILRINADGSIPKDNPFIDKTQGKYQSIWATGLRNPYAFAVRPGTKQLLVTDVGGNCEEVNIVEAGNDMGWPTFNHGPINRQGFRSPVHYYPQSCVCGATFAPESWPEEYRGRFLFADFVHGWIRILNLDNPTEFSTFGQQLRRPVDLRSTQDGTLYILMRNAWVLDGRTQSGTGSLIAVKYKPQGKIVKVSADVEIKGEDE